MVAVDVIFGCVSRYVRRPVSIANYGGQYSGHLMLHLSKQSDL